MYIPLLILSMCVLCECMRCVSIGVQKNIFDVYNIWEHESPRFVSYVSLYTMYSPDIFALVRTFSKPCGGLVSNGISACLDP